MCNLYRLTSPREAVADLFKAHAGVPANHAAEVYPGYSGLVVAGGEVQTMTWGFPLVLKSKRTGQPLKPKPVNNTREDKLHAAFWRDSFVHRRCLIPVSAWAEATGEAGRMTRTWYSMPDRDMCAVAGIWRPTVEWGKAYSMVMVDSCATMGEDHDRMPTIIHQADWKAWTEGTPDQAVALCQVWGGQLAVDRTEEPWSTKVASNGASSAR